MKKKNLSRLSIIKGRINFVCLMEACPKSCCGPFGGVQIGIDSVDGREFHDIRLTADDSKRLLEAGCAELITRAPNNEYHMRLMEDGTCVAFKNGHCTIHKEKPTLCRAFPFYIDMFVGLCGVTSCAGFGQGWTDLANLAEEIEATKEMYRFWLDDLKNTGYPFH